MSDSEALQKVSEPPRQPQGEGLVHVASRYPVDETVERLKRMLQANGVTLFYLMDHSGEAKKAGMDMLPTKLLIFGNPKAGTPLMLAAPTIAIDLPLKILVWEEAGERVWVTYNSPDFLQKRHQLPAELKKAIDGVATLAMKASQKDEAA